MEKIVDRYVMGNILRDARKSSNMTQCGVADRTGISERELGNIENGLTEPKFNTIVVLCSIYGISIDQLAQQSVKSPLGV